MAPSPFNVGVELSFTLTTHIAIVGRLLGWCGLSGAPLSPPQRTVLATVWRGRRRFAQTCFVDLSGIQLDGVPGQRSNRNLEALVLVVDLFDHAVEILERTIRNFHRSPLPKGQGAWCFSPSWDRPRIRGYFGVTHGIGRPCGPQNPC